MKNVTLLILENEKLWRKAGRVGRVRHILPFNIQLYLEHPISDEKWKKGRSGVDNFITDGASIKKSKRENVCILMSGQRIE